MRLGTNTFGEEVVVRREVGSREGYNDRLQAIAVARLGGAEPAAVAQTYNGKWHALETTANFYFGLVGASDAPLRALYGVPSSIAPTANTASPLSIETRASFIFGVPESEIKPNISSAGRKAGKININPVLTKDSGGKDVGAHGPEGGPKDEDFQLGQTSALEIDLAQLDKPAEAQATMFHEVSHLKDFELAQQWVKQYQDETGLPFVSQARGPFTAWILAQSPKRLSAADAELVKDVVMQAHATTEARAHVHTFLAALQAGAADLATDRLVVYAEALKPGGSIGDPGEGSKVKAALTNELASVYLQMPRPMRAQFDAALAAAKNANPDAWVSELHFAHQR